MISSDINEIIQYDKESAEVFVKQLLGYTYAEWFMLLEKEFSKKEIDSKYIPQFSNFDVGTSSVVLLLRQLGDYGPTYQQIGKDLLGRGKKSLAYIKYGENHAKLAMQMGLLKIQKKGQVTNVYLSEVGKVFDKLDDEQKWEYLMKTVLLIPIVYNISLSVEPININEELSKYLAKTTAIRRASNIRKLIKLVKATYGESVDTERYINLG